MTPQPSFNRIVRVSMSPVAASLGYVTVLGQWQTIMPRATHWKLTKVGPTIPWRTVLPPRPEN